VKPYALGVDIGGTTIKAGMVDRDANIVERYKTHEHCGTLPENVISCVEQVYRALLQQSGIQPASLAGVGLGFAGHVNGRAGVVITSSNLPEWDNVPLRDIVQQRLGVPVVLENDTKVCGLAEYMHGAGRGVDNMCYVTLSTGYGLAIARMACEKISSGADTILRDTCGDDPTSATGEMIAEAARQGDAVARDLITTAGYYAGIGLSTIVHVVNPELIVIGGGMTRIGPMFMDPCMQGLKENVHPVLFDSVRIVPWQLGDDSGVLGAAAKAFVTFDEKSEECPSE